MEEFSPIWQWSYKKNKNLNDLLGPGGMELLKSIIDFNIDLEFED